MRFTDRIKQTFINQTKRKMELSHEQRLKNFQMALSMVGVTANLMTCELIHSLSALVDEKGEAFALKDANETAARIQAKYQPQGMPNMGPPQGQGGMPPIDSLPPELQKAIREGKIQMMPKQNRPEPAPLKEEIPLPELEQKTPNPDDKE